MIANRQQGLVNAYAVIAALIAVFFLLVYSGLVGYLPWIHLSPPERLVPYCVAVFVGMLISMSGLRKRGYNLHLMGRFGGISLALRQVLHVSACLFGLMFVLKDHAISRLFLVPTYFFWAFILHSCTGRFRRN
ncbi:MAG: hypothetical protein H2172_17440 [Opitutus sp.]|nr:hypothetical protein [Opitutus sp.]MCS6278717.1 hypothetical protein [Opitutus sp.]MCS6299705.1 hypothetical protein [Opitutus sp.]